jgi:hypothetical protein
LLAMRDASVNTLGPAKTRLAMRQLFRNRSFR